MEPPRVLSAQSKFEPVDAEAEPVLLLHTPLRVALALVAAAAIAGWLALVGLHSNDDYRVTHNTGVWIAVAESARAGSLYPPIFDGEHYAGTRYMPLPILLTAFASALAGDPLIGGKLLAASLMAILLGLIVVMLRRLSCPGTVAVALAATVIGTDAGLQAGSSIGGDVLPVLLQVAVLALAASPSLAMLIVAGGVAGLAAASKLTGLWALAAVTTWLALQRQWRRAAIFAATCVAIAAVILGSVQLLTGGGLSEHLFAFSVAGVHSPLALLRGPNQVLYNLLGFAAGTVVLFPLAVLGVLLSGDWRRVSVIHLALGYALVLLLAVYADVGTGANQLLDVVVLTALGVGYLAGRAATDTNRRAGQIILGTVIVAVLWAAGIGLVRTIGFDLRRSGFPGRGGTPPPRTVNLIASMVQPGQQVLAEDPSVYVAMGRRPVVMDPFMVMRLEYSDPHRVDPLISWIAERRFGLVVLVVSLDDKSVEYWWNDFHYGPRVVAALRKAYRADGLVGRYYIYRPRP